MPTITPIELATDIAEAILSDADLLLRTLRPSAQKAARHRKHGSSRDRSDCNTKRAARCSKVLDEYAEDMAECNLVDLLTDAMHWCRATGTPFQQAIELARRHFTAEKTTTGKGSEL
jgi:hypothetical protein